MKVLFSATLFVMATALFVSAYCYAESSPEPLKIGVLNDQSGPYAEVTGKGSVLAAQMAVEDFGGKVIGRPIQVVAADHQNKPDLGVSIARSWYDAEKVSAIFDVPASAVALGVLEMARNRNKIVVFSGAASPDLTGKFCAGTSFGWSYDSYSLASGTARALVKTGAETWYFLTVDSTAGMAIERDASSVVTAAGGKVLGSVKHPLNTHDFASFLLRAQQSGAKVIGLANAGHDTVNSIRQATEFGIPQGGQRVAGMLVLANDVHSIGLEAARGIFATESFYWDMNDETRAWSKRFMKANGGRPANMIQAGVYSAVLHYLKALNKVGADDGLAVAAAMKAMPVEDFYTKGAVVRTDGRVLRDMYLLQAKAPSESKSEWDLYTIVARIPPEEAFRSLAESGCPLAK